MSGRKKNTKTTKKQKMSRPTRKAKPPAKTTPASEPNMANGEDSDVRLESDIRREIESYAEAETNRRRNQPDAVELPGSGIALHSSPFAESEIEWALCDTESFVIDPFEHLIEARMTRWRLGEGEFGDDLDRAKKLVRPDPDMALAKCRVTLERCLWRFHEKTLGPAGTKPLEQLIRDLARKSTIPRKISALADVVRELGNVGAHPIIDDEDLSHREAQIAMLALVLILEWYERTTNPLASAPEYCI